ncbi:hypothetical protein L6272_06025, partial [Microgenomates group bacterium]|nr:hypothetical protein [Microgenomates group bacterium]
DGFQIKEASKAKALFDFLYLRILKIKEVDQNLLESFRLNLDEFSRQDRQEFKKYIKLSRLKKMAKAALWLA